MLMMTMTQTQLAAVDLNLLVTLDVLLAEESVTRAARRLRLTQSAVSRSLAKLRELFGDELFVRTGAGMRPTRRALELAGPLRRTLGELGALLEPRERFDPASAKRTFEIAALDYTQLTMLAPWSARLPELAPGVDLAIRQLSLPAKRDLEAGALDVYISPRMRTAAGVIWTPLGDDGYTCVVWQGHARRRLSLSSYAKLEHVLVAPGERPGGLADQALAAHGLTRRVSVRVSSFAAVPYLLIGTQRIATLPRGIARLFVEHHPLRTIDPPIELPRTSLSLAWHELHRDDPGHKWLREQLLGMARP
jgi:DNA-binding transcriptional LysR family regulator